MVLFAVAMIAMITTMPAMAVENGNDGQNVEINVLDSLSSLTDFVVIPLTNFISDNDGFIIEAEGNGADIDVFAIISDDNGLDEIDSVVATVYNDNGAVIDSASYAPSGLYVEEGLVFGGIIPDDAIVGGLYSELNIPRDADSGEYEVEVVINSVYDDVEPVVQSESMMFTSLLMYTISDIDFGDVDAGRTVTTTFDVVNNYGNGEIIGVEFSDITIKNSVAGDSIIPASEFRTTIPEDEIPQGETMSIEVSCDVPYGINRAIEGVEGTMTVVFDETPDYDEE